jgi:hypothetical protein
VRRLCQVTSPSVLEAALRAHLSFLADDLLEGRGTGQRGGALAVRYLETQAAAIGLKPGGRALPPEGRSKAEDPPAGQRR